MKRQNKKAFTLVELLVVIAILAILASVAVVGYTSFIKNAAVSNDENVVAQMNRYLEALKADSTSEFYGKDIDDSNIGALLAELKAQGLESVEPHAEKYGYHYYFNEEDQKFVLKDNDAGLITGAGRHFSLFASAANDGTYNSLSPYSCFTEKGYLFADLGGEWAELVEGFGSVTSADQLAELYEGAGNMEIGGQPIHGLAALMDVTAFVTEEGIFQTSDKDRVNVEVQDAPTGNIKNEETGEVLYPVYGYVKVLGGSTEDLSADNPLINVPSEEKKEVILPEGVTYIATAFRNFVIKQGSTITQGDQTVEFNVNLTITKEDVEDIEKILDVDTDIEINANIHIFNKNGVRVTLEATREEGSEDVTTTVQIGDDAKNKQTITLKNKVTAFNLEFVQSNKTQKIDDTSSYIAWDGGSFEFKVDSFEGEIKNQPVINAEIEWSIVSINGNENAEAIKGYEAYVKVANGVLTLTGDYENVPEIDEIVVKAVPKIAANESVYKQYTLKVVRVTGVKNLKINGTPVVEGMNITLLNNGTDTVYDITHDGLEFNGDFTGLCAQDLAWTYNGATGGNTITVNGEGSGDLVITIGSYLKYNVRLSTGNTSNFAFVPANGNITVLGNGNAVKLSDLFKLRDGAQLPEGATLVISKGQTGPDDKYMTPDRFESDIVAANNIKIENTAFENYTIQFTDDSGANKVRIWIMQNGVRISEDVEVTVVDALNVKDYSEFALNDSNAFTKNIVLLGDLAMSKNGYMTIGAAYTLYGNGYEFDVTAGRNADGIIDLKGKIRDIKIVGAVYSDFAFSAGDSYGSSVVRASGNAYIYNSYIANTRSPLRIDGGTVTVENTVLFGGRYANIDTVGGTVTIKGTVTTVQQLYNDVIGVGVSAWFNDNKKNVVIEDGANFIQYNFMNEEIKAKLPKLTLLTYEIMDLKEPFDYIFSNSDEYGKYTFTGSDGKSYVNSGMVATDKYMLPYTVTGQPTKKYTLFGIGYIEYAKNAIKTVKSESIDVTQDYIIEYYTKFAPTVGEVVTPGYVKVTGAQLKAGVEFKAVEKLSFTITNGDGTSFMFQVQHDNYKSLNVTGADGYNSLTYTFTKDLSGKMGLVEDVSSLHNKGLHYGKMCVDVYTFEKTDTTYQQYLENYINMGGFYYPGNYNFVNGSIVNYTPSK